MRKLINLLKNSKRVGIIAHTSPDADCMGSMAALSYILKKLGKRTDCFIDTKVLDHNSIFNIDKNIDKDMDISTYDTLISVDIATPRLMGKYYTMFKDFKNNIVIDHHTARDLEGNYTYVDQTKASCAEIVFDIANKLKIKFDSYLATILFAGIVGDSGCFQNDNVSATTHLTASKLYALGADTRTVIFEVAKHEKMADIKLRQSMYQNMVIEDDVAYYILTKKMQKEIGTDNVGNIVNELLNIDSNKIAFIIKQKEKNTYSVSLRCKFGYDVAVIANMFDGGGHTQAAGMVFVGAPIKTAKAVMELCKRQINGENNV